MFIRVKRLACWRNASASEPERHGAATRRPNGGEFLLRRWFRMIK